MLQAYRKHIVERAAIGTVPKPLNAIQVNNLIELLKDPPAGEDEFLLDLLTNRIPPGVDEAAYVKANFLDNIVKGRIFSPLVNDKRAIELLGTMQGGYSINPLIEALDNLDLAPIAFKALSNTLLIFDNFDKIKSKAKDGNKFAQLVIQSWADARWFLDRPPLDRKITVVIFKVKGETNTDDLSPAQDAWSRPDIPLHALSMLKNHRDGIKPDLPGSIGPITQIRKLKQKGIPLAYVGDIVGTGSSRKSAANSILWFIGKDIPYVPNKRFGGFILGGKIAPIFFNTMEDAGALPIELDVSNLHMNDIVDIYPFSGEIRNHENNKLIVTFKLKNDVLLDEVRAGGRIRMVIGRNLTMKSRKELNMPLVNNIFHPININKINCRHGYSLAQKIVGKACGVIGVSVGSYCEPKITSIGSQDTTGPMTRDELKDLACLRFSSDLFIQSFCHTAAYPKPVDIITHKTLPDFIMDRGGISLRPGDGIIHSWLNRMLLPDTVGTGGDSHTRFPIGISFPAGSGMVAFAAATGIMPLDMPESVLVRFHGKINHGITLRDLVNSIPFIAIRRNLLTVEKSCKKNIFSGRILEIEGLPNLKVEQAFELTNSSAERSSAGCTIKLNKEPIIEYLNSNVSLLKWMMYEGYGCKYTIERRIRDMNAWLASPKLLEADIDAQYAAIIDIDLEDIREPILCIPNDPDDVHLLSELHGNRIDEVFIGSCMTNINHFRMIGNILKFINEPLKAKLWIAPPTRMDEKQLIEEGYYDIFNRKLVRVEISGCSLCMGNQARVNDNSTVISTSTRNFPNRLGTNANVYLSSAEVAIISAILGKIPNLKEYKFYITLINRKSINIY